MNNTESRSKRIYKMRFLTKRKDGGPESTVTAYILIEIKCLFSIMLLRFDGSSRPVYHTHAFNSISWLLKGCLVETTFGHLCEQLLTIYKPSIKPIHTLRLPLHKVDSIGVSWVLTFRGPWLEYWFEYDPATNTATSLTHGRIKT